MKVWKKLKYLQKGVIHEQNGTNCQDSVRIFENENCIVAALADGLGSLKFSEIAAETATETVCRCFSELGNPLEQFSTKTELAQYILNTSVMNIQNKATEAGCPLSEMDCTLMFVCVLKKTTYAIIGQLGDSAVCVIADPKSIAINDGNKSANGTNAILDKDAIDHFFIQIIDLDKNNIQGFILSSDGLENELYMKGSDHVNKSAELYFNAWYVNPDPVSVIKERISKLTEIEGAPFDDDISIAILSRADKEIFLPADPTWLCTCGFRNHLQTTYCQKCHKDFSVLYQHIRFRDYGGKASFFSSINKDPREEMRIIGMSEEEIESKISVSSPEDKVLKGKNQKIVSAVESNTTADSQIETPLISPVENSTAPDIQNPSKNVMKESRSNDGNSNASVTANDKGKGGLSDFKPSETRFGRKQENADKLKKKQIQSIPLAKNNTVSGEKPIEERKKRVNNNLNGKTDFSQLHPAHIYQAKTQNRRNDSDTLIIVILMLIMFMLGLFVGGICVRTFTSKKVNELSETVKELTNTVRQYEMDLIEKEELPDNLLPKDFLVLEDGSYYWGKVDDQSQPNGFGILEKEGRYYIGNYNHGIKNGKFSVVGGDTEQHIETYSNNQIVTENDSRSIEENSKLSSSMTKNPQMYETQQFTYMRERPDKDSNLIMMLNAGTTVYLLDIAVEEADGLDWLHIKTEDGYEGWIIAEALNL